MPLLDFTNPYEMLLFIDDDMREGRAKLHEWQIEFMEDFAARDYTEAQPFKAAGRAANGSGKDKYIIACCVVWFAMHYQSSISVITSSSGVQLDRQTNNYVNMLCSSLNQKLGTVVWKLNYRHYMYFHDLENQENTMMNAEIIMYATDEPGKAEGYHPKVNGGKMAIFVSEAKSVPDDIFVAIARCTGFTHRVDVSSPGLPMGNFFNVCTGARKRKEVKRSEITGGDWIEYHITAYDCSHISLNTIEEMKRLMPGGESGAAFQSAVMAEFGTTDEMVVIQYSHVWKSVRKHTLGHLPEAFNTAGLDLSAGGDETALAIRNGNKLLKVIPFRFTDTQDTIDFLEEKFKEFGLKHYESKIIADAGGLGKPIIDDLKRRGWKNVRYVWNQSKPKDPKVYLNRGTEMWFEFGKLLEKGEIWLCEDDRTIRQLSSRYYKITEGTKHRLESKIQARAAGRCSPDRADAVILCFSNYKSKLEDVVIEPPFEYKSPVEEYDSSQSPLEIRRWAKGEDNFKGYQMTHSKFMDFKMLKDELEEINKQKRESKVGV